MTRWLLVIAFLLVGCAGVEKAEEKPRDEVLAVIPYPARTQFGFKCPGVMELIDTNNDQFADVVKFYPDMACLRKMQKPDSNSESEPEERREEGIPS